jgi:hypothetical protein
MNNFLAVTYAFMLGFCPVDQIGTNETFESYENASHTQFELGVDLFNAVHIYGGEETFQRAKGSLFNWYPYTQSYWIGAEYHKTFNEKFSLTAGVNHKCQHPVDTWEEHASTFNGSRTEIYLKVSGKIEIF